MPTRFVHTNLVARDWRHLAIFYQTDFDCVPVPPERDLSGDWLEKATGIDKAHLRGMHLRLPGHGDQGTTLEIFQYDALPSHADIKPNTPGFSHIAFAVDDVAATAEAVRQAGGRDVGKLTEIRVAGVGFLIFQYLADPEGNIVEIQKWIRDGHPSR
jgi:catechol 2,3-dioxygenase-like lactoylglutathione lyase family enzyme